MNLTTTRERCSIIVCFGLVRWRPLDYLIKMSRNQTVHTPIHCTTSSSSTLATIVPWRPFQLQRRKIGGCIGHVVLCQTEVDHWNGTEKFILRDSVEVRLQCVRNKSIEDRTIFDVRNGNGTLGNIRCQNDHSFTRCWLTQRSHLFLMRNHWMQKDNDEFVLNVPANRLAYRLCYNPINKCPTTLSHSHHVCTFLNASVHATDLVDSRQKYQHRRLDVRWLVGQVYAIHYID